MSMSSLRYITYREELGQGYVEEIFFTKPFPPDYFRFRVNPFECVSGKFILCCLCCKLSHQVADRIKYSNNIFEP